MQTNFRQRGMSRRTLLRSAGVSLALPMLSAMQPAFASSEETPKRFIAICAGLGFHGPFLFPDAPGPLKPSTPYLNRLREHLDQITLFSGLSHPNQNGNNGHASGMTWLTSAQRPGLAGFKNTISLDQQMAAKLAVATRFPYLALTATGPSLSWTSSGVNIPAESSPAKLFKKLFIAGTEDQIQEQVGQLQRGRSILDTVSGQAKRLNQKLGPTDRDKLDQYYSSVRELEDRLLQSEQWAKKPKPAVDYEPPTDVRDKQDIIAKQRLMYDMVQLALQTDSTRVVTYTLGSMNAVPSNIAGVKTDWHNLSHHGKDEEKIDELRLVEQAEFDAFATFLTELKSVSEQGRTLLDHTAILFGSNLGNASSHDWRNLPIIVAGGGYQHGQYVAHDQDDNTPLANLFVPLAHRMGLEIDRFGSSTQPSLRGLKHL